MPDNNNQELIISIVKSFYEKATQDVLIGYHFRKIQLKSGIDHHPLRPPIEAFAHHLPRINEFWMVQLGEKKKSEIQFDLIDVHRALFIRPGELGRWIALFNQTLDEKCPESHLDFKLKWRQKIEHFEEIFKRKLF
jgi:truncated hemoglobin YjbI